VWFEGVYFDVGGGYEKMGLLDILFYWMVCEVYDVGFVFDVLLLNYYVNSGFDFVWYNLVNGMYKVDNLLFKVRMSKVFIGGWCCLINDYVLFVWVVSSVVIYF